MKAEGRKYVTVQIPSLLYVKSIKTAFAMRFLHLQIRFTATLMFVSNFQISSFNKKELPP